MFLVQRGKRVSQLNQLELFYSVPFMSPEEHYQSVFILPRIAFAERSFGGKIPLETAGFSHSLFNLPQTFVKELKGINRRNSSVETLT